MKYRLELTACASVKSPPISMRPLSHRSSQAATCSPNKLDEMLNAEKYCEMASASGSVEFRLVVMTLMVGTNSVPLAAHSVTEDGVVLTIAATN